MTYMEYLRTEELGQLGLLCPVALTLQRMNTSLTSIIATAEYAKAGIFARLHLKGYSGLQDQCRT